MIWKNHHHHSRSTFKKTLKQFGVDRFALFPGMDGLAASYVEGSQAKNDQGNTNGTVYPVTKMGEIPHFIHAYFIVNLEAETKENSMNSLNVSTQSFYYWLPSLQMPDKNPLENSGTYAACEQMIQMPCMRMGLAKLDEMLDRLEKNGRLSLREHQSLLELATKTWRVDA